MKDQHINEENIKKMLQSIKQEEQVSPEVEPAVMRNVAARKEYKDQIKLYQNRAKITFLVSAIALILFGISSTLELSDGANDPVQIVSFSVLAGIGIAFTFIAMQIKSTLNI